jgi:hypothetical protein
MTNFQLLPVFSISFISVFSLKKPTKKIWKAELRNLVFTSIQNDYYNNLNKCIILAVNSPLLLTLIKKFSWTWWRIIYIIY